MKSLGDAIALRNRLIEHLEEADTECAANDREPLLTFVVAGEGFAGECWDNKGGPLLGNHGCSR
jgi:NADH:ubiquinone reductase (H+-translocating)